MTAAAGELRHIPLAELQVAKANPRKDAGDVADLAESIRTHGIITPLVAYQENGHYAVIDGSRRLAAAKLAKVATAPVYVRDAATIDVEAQALVANLKRQDLNPLEEAEGYARWLELTGKPQKDLAAAVGKDPSTISNALRMLRAPKRIREKVRTGELTPAHVRVLLSVKDERVLEHLTLSSGERLTVDNLKYTVQEAERRFLAQGPDAVEAARKVRDTAVKNHAGYVITWSNPQYGETLRLESEHALGKPPAKVEGEIWEGSVPRHDKACKCRAFAVVPAQTSYLYDNKPARFKLERVCVDPKGYKEFSGSTPRSQRQPDPYARPTTKAGKIAYVNKRVDGHLKVKVGGGWGRRRPADPVFRKLVAGGWDSEGVARLLAYAFTVDSSIKVGAEQLELWNRIRKMPLAKLRALVLEHAAAEINGEVLDSKDGGTRLAARVAVMQGFGIPVGPQIAAEAEKVVAKLQPRTKTKKAAKR